MLQDPRFSVIFSHITKAINSRTYFDYATACESIMETFRVFAFLAFCLAFNAVAADPNTCYPSDAEVTILEYDNSGSDVAKKIEIDWFYGTKFEWPIPGHEESSFFKKMKRLGE